MKNSYSSHSFDSQNVFHPSEHRYCPWDGYKFTEHDTECQTCGHTRFKVSK